jgi:hypothetical protein
LSRGRGSGDRDGWPARRGRWPCPSLWRRRLCSLGLSTTVRRASSVCYPRTIATRTSAMVEGDDEDTRRWGLPLSRFGLAPNYNCAPFQEVLAGSYGQAGSPPRWLQTTRRLSTWVPMCPHLITPEIVREYAERRHFPPTGGRVNRRVCEFNATFDSYAALWYSVWLSHLSISVWQTHLAGRPLVFLRLDFFPMWASFTTFPKLTCCEWAKTLKYTCLGGLVFRFIFHSRRLAGKQYKKHFHREVQVWRCMSPAIGLSLYVTCPNPEGFVIFAQTNYRYAPHENKVQETRPVRIYTRRMTASIALSRQCIVAMCPVANRIRE